MYSASWPLNEKFRNNNNKYYKNIHFHNANTDKRERYFESSKRFERRQVWNCKGNMGDASHELVWAIFQPGLSCVPARSILVPSAMMVSSKAAF